jgi:hypothetical protein
MKRYELDIGFKQNRERSRDLNAKEVEYRR